MMTQAPFIATALIEVGAGLGISGGMMEEVFKFAATFKEFPPRSIPPSFHPATIMENVLDDIRDEQ
ncbi:MAG: hypothetical protein GDA67_12375 [Nitrospira sp. CR1.3]|nr:hypothetical protein [Nitrospira sp. CR1.3]